MGRWELRSGEVRDAVGGVPVRRREKVTRGRVR
jgi:hypothetical protein